MSYLTKEGLFGQLKRRIREEECPLFGDRPKVRFRSLTEGELSRYEAMTLTQGGKLRGDRLVDAKRRLLVLTVIDQHGEPLFSSSDVDALADCDGRVINWMYRIACEHCGIKEDEIEELVGNCDTIDVDDSRSSSRD